MSEAKENVEMMVGERHGKVFIRFRHPMEEIIFDPKNAVSVGEELARLSYKAEYGVWPEMALKTKVADEKRDKLIQRVSVMLGSMDQKTNGQKAMAIVDTVLSEVF